MNPAEFRTLLARSGLTQGKLAALVGLSLTTVNRYCSPKASDRKRVPMVMVGLVVAWSLLSDRQQATLRARLGDIKDQGQVAIWCFHRGWAIRSEADGSIDGWTADVTLAGRWTRERAPEEFGTVLVEDPHWPTLPGVQPIHPQPPDRPRPKKRPPRPAPKDDSG